jgi:hypothetical protein
VRLGELRDSVRRERRERHPGERQPRRHLAEHDPDRMARVERVVAVAQDDQHTIRRDPARQQPEHVERRLVGPVHVLHDQHGRLVPAQLLDQRRRHLVRDRLTQQPLRELGAYVGGEVVNRPQRPRREKRIARPAQHPRRAGPLRAEPPDQRRLAAPRLRRNQRHPPPPRSRLLECGFEHGQLALTLDEQIDLRVRVVQQAHSPHRDP